ncbi:MAG: Ig-like domain-containing protein [Pleurocapsa sp.]
MAKTGLRYSLDNKILEIEQGLIQVIEGTEISLFIYRIPNGISDALSSSRGQINYSVSGTADINDVISLPSDDSENPNFFDFNGATKDFGFGIYNLRFLIPDDGIAEETETLTISLFPSKNDDLVVGQEQVTIRILDAEKYSNTSPLVAVDDRAKTRENTPVNIDVLANDINHNGKELAITIVSNPDNGSVAINDNGTPTDLTDDFVVYTPNPGFSGLDSFSYSISDGTNTDTTDAAIEVLNGGIIDLRDINLEFQSVLFTISREAEFNNTVGFYQVNPDGSVNDAFGNTIAPGDEGYLEAAIANRLDFSFSPANGEQIEAIAQIPGGITIAPFLVVDGGLEQVIDDNFNNNPEVYFAFAAANSDNFDHLRTSENKMGFEDLPYGGDLDFDDIMLEYSFGN